VPGDLRLEVTGDNTVRFLEFYNTTSSQSRYKIENSNGALIFRDYQGTAIFQMLTQGQGSTMTGNLTATGVIKPKVGTVAGLPAAASWTGAIAHVTDATATTARSTVAGGGSNKVLVFSDGTNWLIAA
jgi:hypothetical protein